MQPPHFNNSTVKRTLKVHCNYSPTSIKRPPLGLWKSGRLIEIGRLTEVQYKLDRNGGKHNLIAFMKQNAKSKS